ncbi:uncharacterized protein LOC134515300 [Chroicocephalus ridibundus]|uniref:uncharacterized protein LOC134515300 n=1 Tax=Chroicocephalus ridibundus TaxID=1192867 RepID=UPI002FDC9E7B
MDSMTDRGYSSSASFTLPGGLSWWDGGAGSTQLLRTPPSPQGCQGEGAGARASPLRGAPTGTANKDHARGLLDLLHIFKAWGERQQRGEPMARLPWPDSPWREPAAGRAASASEISPNGWEVWGREPPGVPHFSSNKKVNIFSIPVTVSRSVLSLDRSRESVLCNDSSMCYSNADSPVEMGGPLPLVHYTPPEERDNVYYCVYYLYQIICYYV